MKLSIITVSLNSGDKLLKTVQSAAAQSFRDFELIVKDGGSADGSVEKLKSWLARGKKPEENPDGIAGKTEGRDDAKEKDAGIAARVRIFQEKDSGIYDGMNRGAALAQGEYLYFLNCGDVFHGPDALEKFAAGMEDGALLYYGNVYDVLRGSVVQSNPRLDAFACYRNVPNHQACVYHRSLFAERGYRTEYRVRADYEHFLWCFFEKKVCPGYVPVTLADYEGGGFSETSANKKRSAAEHKEITALYMSPGQRFLFRAALIVTLQPLRTALAENETTGKAYQKLKKLIYRR
ncbi:MAG: glycosyltransferase [Lachnospiraceae bacterium]|nr:glycosyltransferase [Lachnospiraceae bacterium]